MADFKFEITKEIAVLSDKKGYTKELNMVSYNDKPAVYDLRTWYVSEETGEKKMTKGITMSLDEVKALRDALNDLDL